MIGQFSIHSVIYSWDQTILYILVTIIFFFAIQNWYLSTNSIALNNTSLFLTKNLFELKTVHNILTSSKTHLQFNYNYRNKKIYISMHSTNHLYWEHMVVACPEISGFKSIYKLIFSVIYLYILHLKALLLKFCKWYFYWECWYHDPIFV